MQRFLIRIKDTEDDDGAVGFDGKVDGIGEGIDRLDADSGNLTEFDEAVKERDVEKVVEILMRIELNNSSIEPILKQLGLK